MILFEHDAVDYQNMGIGSLPDCINDSVTEETNGLYELTFEYPITGIRFKELRFRRIVFCKPNPYTRPQPFRIYEITTPINGIVNISATHISYDTSGYPIENFTSENMTDMVAKLNGAKIVPNPFVFNSNITSAVKIFLETPQSIRSVLGGSIVDAYKPEYQYDHFEVSILKERGTQRDQIIRYGVNLIDFSQEENISNVYTSVFPCWTNHGNNDVDIMKTLPEKLVPTPGTWSFSRVLHLDLSSEFKEEPTHEEMRAKTIKYISDNEIGVPTVSLTLSFLQISDEPILLGDTVTVDFILCNIKTKARCVKTVYSPRLDRYTDIELGKPKGNIANTIVSGFGETTKQFESTKSYVDNAVGSAPGATTSATALTSGTLKSTNNNFKMNLDNGDFEIGGVNTLTKHTKDYSLWSHGSESTTVSRDGLKIANRPYHNLMLSGTGDITDKDTNQITINLPSEWVGKSFEVMVSVNDTKNTTNPILNTILKVINKDLTRATFKVEGFITTSIGTSPIKFNYIAIGG